ncbi:MAG TPA: hypothetical protein VGM88_08620 [Kofleriaceae bacterium]|jgi:hypothetical protein
MTNELTDPEQKVLRRAVDTHPNDEQFDDAVDLLEEAREGKPRADALLCILQPERHRAEKRALRRGTPASSIGKERAGKRKDGSRIATGIFEADVRLIWLPSFIDTARTARASLHKSLSCDVYDRYSEQLRQHGRTERVHNARASELPVDARSSVELTANEDDAGFPAPTMATAWMPAMADEVVMVCWAEIFEKELDDPIDLKVAQLMLLGLVDRGSKTIIASALDISPVRVSRAVDNIGAVMKRPR